MLLKIRLEILNGDDKASVLQEFFASGDVRVRAVSQELNNGLRHALLILSQRRRIGAQKRDQKHEKFDFGRYEFQKSFAHLWRPHVLFDRDSLRWQLRTKSINQEADHVGHILLVPYDCEERGTFS